MWVNFRSGSRKLQWWVDWFLYNDFLHQFTQIHPLVAEASSMVCLLSQWPVHTLVRQTQGQFKVQCLKDNLKCRLQQPWIEPLTFRSVDDCTSPEPHRDTMWHKTWLRQTIPLYNLQAQDCEAAVWLVEFWFFLNMYCLARNVKPHEREPHFHVIGRWDNIAYSIK